MCRFRGVNSNKSLDAFQVHEVLLIIYQTESPTPLCTLLVKLNVFYYTLFQLNQHALFFLGANVNVLMNSNSAKHAGSLARFSEFSSVFDRSHNTTKYTQEYIFSG